MPATEQTWRDQKRLHWIFMVSGVGLLGATLWMFSSDHNREWKRYQDQARDVDLAFNEWTQLQYRTDEQFREHEKLTLAWDMERSRPVADKDLDQFDLELAAFAKSQTDAAREKQPTAAAVDPVSIESIRKLNEQSKEASAGVTDAVTQDAVSKRQDAIKRRERVLTELREIIADVQFREKVMLTKRKETNAELDAAKANVDIAVRDSYPAAQARDMQLAVQNKKADVEQLSLAYQRLNDHRKALDAILKSITAAEDDMKKKVDANRAALKNLEIAHKQRDLAYINWVGPFPMPGKRMLTLPIIDAFQSPRKIDNLWSDDNTINYNFRYVRRFDRCTTCHQLLEKSQAGSAEKPAYVRQRDIQLTVITPDRARVDEILAGMNGSAEDENARLYAIFGIRLADAGLLAKNDVTVSLVRPEGAAAKALVLRDESKQTGEQIQDALIHSSQESEPTNYPIRPGLLTGDVLTEIDGNPIHTREQAERLLLHSVKWGAPLAITVRRGVPNPYTSHPRLDLYVGSMSPHKMSTFACTTCHEGQGSATAFQWASHTPDTVMERKKWVREHNWADNAHWIFPMFSKRFAESACLKCHHEVLELESSERFPEAPGPKVTHGHHLILKYGCFGCHEINGFDGPTRRVGPDMRVEPNVFAAAQQFKTTAEFKKLKPQQQGWLDELIVHPERNEIRRRLYSELISMATGEEPFSGATMKLVALFKDVEGPGRERKPGPSLRYAATKMDESFLFDWISDPTHFRASTRMPRFFGLHNHLNDEPQSKAIARKYETIEVLSIVAYLRQRSQPFEYLAPAEGMTPSTKEEQIARGKIAFEERGCLACHTHKDFPGVNEFRKPEQIVQGPDLSAIGSKFGDDRHPQGRQWLYSWIRQPTRYHVRTVMPDLFLEPVVKKDEDGKVVEITDPVSDIVAFLLTSTSEWTAKSEQTPSLANRETRQTLDELVRDNLKEVFSSALSDRYLRSGIPASMAKELKGAEIELVVGGGDARNLSDDQKLQYIGRKAVGKYGCFGCHDIPGFEDAKPIGTALADWGRKESSKLAFEHITHYLQHGHGHASPETDHGSHDAPGPQTPKESHAGGVSHSDSHSDTAADEAFYHHQIESGNRIGFIWQKLKEPRSYDFRKTENKRYNERLRMPQFPFSASEREAVMTYVMGLVSDPPPSKYLYRPDARNAALVEGRRVLDKYNCAGCHMLSPQKWSVAYAKDALQPPEFEGFPFLKSHADAEFLNAAAKVDYQGLIRSTIQGMPTVSDDNARPIIEDDQGDRLEPDASYQASKLVYRLDLLKPAVINGGIYEVGVMPLALTSSQIESRVAPDGGVLARYLVAPVVRREKEINPAAKGSEAWGWVPPPLLNEGSKVQSSWLHDFLLNPYPIRPSVVLRMPRFNMTSDEATALARYFAAVDNAEYPYDLNDRRQSNYLVREEQEYQSHLTSEGIKRETTRFDDAMRIVTNNNYCVKCHLVSDFEPKGSNRAKAPNLARVFDRLRPEFVRNWVANPKQALPYTSMPQNIPYPAGIDKNLYHGDSIQQLDALVDLLMNYDDYSRQHSLIAPLVQQNQTPPPPTTGAGGN